MNRFRVLFRLTVTLFFLFQVFNNETLAQGVNFGFTGGMNISSHTNQFKYSDGDINLGLEPQILAGYQGGLVFRTNFSRIVRLQIEPSISRLGAIYRDDFSLRGFEFHTESKTELLYVQMPLLLQLSTRPPNRTIYGREPTATTYHLTGGVFGGYLLDARFSGTNTGAPIGVTFEGKFSNDVSSQYSDYDGGAVFGVGFEHGQSKKMGLEARAYYSVIDSGNAPEISFKPHNMAVTFAVYFLL